ncbi:hypothetical protein CEXT_723821 [Caerostris extrusa]|uniref:Uncharacterized protein n=1 Tax=Caerostris extrusa TaxID=172846 RepID=A0AAV4M8F6_CAEEX|nr:hypothetical protein CEXT_723821 [Caerostris extrusa]
MRDKFRPSPFLPLQRQIGCAWETDADFTSLQTAIDSRNKTDTLQHPLKGNGPNICMRGQIQLHPLSYLRGKEVHGKPTLISSLVAKWHNRFLATNRHSATSFKGTANICMRGQIQLHPLPPQRQKEQIAIDFSQKKPTLCNILKRERPTFVHEGQNSAPSPFPTSGKSVHVGKPIADFTFLVKATAIDFSQQTDTLQHPLKGTANIFVHEGTNSSSIPLPTSRGAKKCAWETDADFTSLVATAIDFSQQTDTLQHPLKGNGQHLHEGTNSSSIPFLPPEAKKCAWETDADFTSLVATAPISQQKPTLLKGNFTCKFSSIPLGNRR